MWGGVDSFLEFLYGVVTLKIGWSNHLWFLLQIVIIYIFFPVFKIIFDKRKRLFYFLCSLFVILASLPSISFMFINLINKMVYTQIDAINFLNEINNLYTFINIDKFLFSYGYFFIGGILLFNAEKIKEKLLKNKILSNIFLLILLVLFTFGNYFYGSLANIGDIVWHGYSTVFTFLITIIVFILCMFNSPEKSSKLIYLLASQSMGIYIFHYVVLDYVYLLLMNIFVIDYGFKLPVVILTILISFLISFLISKIKYVNKTLKL